LGLDWRDATPPGLGSGPAQMQRVVEDGVDRLNDLAPAMMRPLQPRIAAPPVASTREHIGGIVGVPVRVPGSTTEAIITDVVAQPRVAGRARPLPWSRRPHVATVQARPMRGRGDITGGPGLAGWI